MKRLCVILALAMLAPLMTGTGAAGAQAEPAPENANADEVRLLSDRAEDELLVHFRPGVDDEDARAILEAFNGRVLAMIPGIEVYHVSFDDAVDEAERIMAMEGHPDVEYAEQNGTAGGGGFVPNDPLISNDSSGAWHLYNVNAFDAWDLTRGSEDIYGAILDTGWESANQEFSGARFKPGPDLIGNDSNPEADHPHGVWTLGFMAGNADNNFSAAGMDHRMSPQIVKSLNSNNGSTDAQFAASVVAAADLDPRPRFMSLSLINYTLNNSNLAAIQYARDRDIIMIACAGNNVSADTQLPSATDLTISIGATDINNNVGRFSTGGDFLEFVAPGADIQGLRWRDSGGALETLNGCSFATPIASGILGLMLAADPTLTQEDVREVWQATARDQVGSGDRPGRDRRYGYGLLDAEAAVAAVSQPTPPPVEPTATPTPPPPPVEPTATPTPPPPPVEPTATPTPPPPPVEPTATPAPPVEPTATPAPPVEPPPPPPPVEPTPAPPVEPPPPPPPVEPTPAPPVEPPPPPPPVDGNGVVTVDNTDPSTSQTGNWRVSSGTEPIGSDSLRCNGRRCSFTWEASLPQAGLYDVYTWYTPHPRRSTAVPYDVQHNDGTDQVLVDQTTNTSQWVQLGRYQFSGGPAEVTITAENGQANADAVQFRFVEGPDEGAGFACASDAGTLTWIDTGSSVYWVYKSNDAGLTYNWIGRWKDSTPEPNPQTFADPNATAGDLYQVRQPGIAATGCSVTQDAPLGASVSFGCSNNLGTLTWADVGSSVYWVYKSTDGGATYFWVGRWKASDPAPNPQIFTDPNASAGDLYQLRTPGQPQANCI